MQTMYQIITGFKSKVVKIMANKDKIKNKLKYASQQSIQQNTIFSVEV